MHYEKRAKAITSWSIASGGFWEAETIWGTPRSTGPTRQPVRPYARAGLWHGLHGPFPLAEPLSLSELRAEEATVRDIRDTLEATYAGALYYPFQMRRDGLRAAQGYLSKMPAELVERFPKLAAPAAASGGPPEVPTARGFLGELGADYTPADEQAHQPDRDPFPVDPAVVERGTRSHAKLQNAIAEHARAKGWTVKKPKDDDPRWDVLWLDGSEVWVAEVKSLTASNEERQLRLGIGQLLRYRHRLAQDGVEAHAVLAVEREPADKDWQALCDELSVVLVWPDVMRERI